MYRVGLCEGVLPKDNVATLHRMPGPFSRAGICMPGALSVTHHFLVACLVEDEPAHQGVGQAHTQQEADPVGGVIVPGATTAWGVAACR